MKVLVLGASGMIGNTLLSVISERSEYEVLGTVREEKIKQFFPGSSASNLVVNPNIENHYNKLIDLDYSQADIEVLTTTPLILHSSQIEKLKKDFNNIFIKYGNYDLNFDYEYLLRVIPKINMHEAYAFEVCDVMNIPINKN